MRIDLPIALTPGWDVVPADLVDVAPHLTEWTFAVHRDRLRKEWAVSNIETGYAIGQSWAERRGDAIKKAAMFLAAITPADMDLQTAKAARGNFKKRVTPLHVPKQWSVLK